MTDKPANAPGRRLRSTGLLLLLALPHGTLAAQGFHTEPSCWNEPRVYHTGSPPAELANRVTVIKAPADVIPSGTAVVSPNGAYRFWVRNPDTAEPGPWGAGLVIGAERAQNSVVLFSEVSGRINPSWVNEKLIFVRVPWGRVTFTDLIVDAEENTIIYQEQAIYGENAFRQYQEACGEACPCTTTTTTTATTTATTPAAATEPNPQMPAALPGEDAMIGLLTLPSVFGPEEPGMGDADWQRSPVPVYASPQQGARKLAELDAPADFATREYTYEKKAVVVYEQRPGWYLIGLRGDKRAWLSAKSTADYYPIGELLVRRLSYLNEHWNRKLWQAPTTYRGWNSRLKAGDSDGDVELPVRVTDSLTVGEGLWLQIETLRNDPCTAGEVDQSGNPVIVDRGWIPAYAENGELVAGFYSRGC